MWIVVLLTAFLAIFATMDIRPSLQAEFRTDVSAGVAERMGWQHADDLRACPAADSCTPGKVHVAGLPGQTDGAKYTSYPDGTAVITAWTPPPRVRDDGRGCVAVQLLRVGSGSVYVGLYVAETGTVGRPHGVGGGPLLVVTVPPELRGDLVDGQPVWLTCTGAEDCVSRL